MKTYEQSQLPQTVIYEVFQGTSAHIAWRVLHQLEGTCILRDLAAASVCFFHKEISWMSIWGPKGGVLLKHAAYLNSVVQYFELFWHVCDLSWLSYNGISMALLSI